MECALAKDGLHPSSTVSFALINWASVLCRLNRNVNKVGKAYSMLHMDAFMTKVYIFIWWNYW
jgi:hypothetical protein